MDPRRNLCATSDADPGKGLESAVARSRRYLVALTFAHHRGPGDTWAAARDRAAKAIGIERSYAARIWSRWQEMRDVSGEALWRLFEAYEAMCAASETVRGSNRDSIPHETAKS